MDPLTVILLIVALIGAYFVYKNFIGKKPAAADSDSESDSGSDSGEDDEKKEFTFAELAKHTTKSTKIYVSLKGVVYDVTDSEFYGPGEQYAIFAGKDASYNLAKMSFDESTLNRTDLTDLKRSEKEQLDNYVELYDMKYKEVGNVVEWAKANKKDQ